MVIIIIGITHGVWYSIKIKFIHTLHSKNFKNAIKTEKQM